MIGFGRALFRVVRRAVPAAVAALCILAGSTAPAHAQQNAAQDLLQQLLQGPNTQPGAQGGVVGNTPLDAARTQQRPDALPRENTTLTPTQRVIATRFCEDRLEAKDRDQLLVVTNFSALEQDYCRRAVQLLLLYGYETFDGPRSAATLVNGAVPDTYRLGIGDELVVTFRGQLATTSRVTVDREGRVILPNMSPVPAAGRTFGDFQRDLQARVQSAFIGTEVFVSLGSVRSISVTVLGEVNAPGSHQLTGLSTVIDALSLAGGIKKTGSLRHVTVQRAGASFDLDIYDLLLGRAVATDLRVYEGDRIVVGGLGATVAVAGKVGRPGIYELAQGTDSVTVQTALDLGGGPLREGARVLLRTFDPSGRELTQEVNASARVPRGALLFVEYGEDYRAGTVSIDGAARVPGSRVRAAASSVRALVGGPDSLQPSAYLPFAILETIEPATRSRRYFGVNLMNILSGQLDYVLNEGDRLIVLNVDDVRFLSSARLQAALRLPDLQRNAPNLTADPQREAVAAARVTELEATVARLNAELNTANRQIAILGAVPPAGVVASVPPSTLAAGALAAGAAPGQSPTTPSVSCPSLDVLSMVVQRAQSNRFAIVLQAVTSGQATQVEVARAPDLAQARCPQIFDDNPYLLPFVLEHVVALNGELRVPGAYPATDGTPVGALVAVAGGVTNEVDLSRVEFTRAQQTAQVGTTITQRTLASLTGVQGAAITVGPGDVVRFNPVFTDRDSGPVLLTGEFVRPGYYDIKRGERLSELMARAGGLTSQAYPYGGVFTRERVKWAEQEGLDRAARDVSSAIFTAASRRELQPGTLEALRQLTGQLASTTAIGRVVIEADPAVLQVRPELDVILEPGDILHMPKRPSAVLVTGDVLNPGAQQFVSGKQADAYIRQAGGLQRSADRSRMFILYPNGVAQPISTSVWNYGPTVQIPPGSAVVAPRDPAPFGLESIRDITSLVGQLALTAASIAVIAR